MKNRLSFSQILQKHNSQKTSSHLPQSRISKIVEKQPQLTPLSQVMQEFINYPHQDYTLYFSNEEHQYDSFEDNQFEIGVNPLDSWVMNQTMKQNNIKKKEKNTNKMMGDKQYKFQANGNKNISMSSLLQKITSSKQNKNQINLECERSSYDEEMLIGNYQKKNNKTSLKSSRSESQFQYQDSHQYGPKQPSVYANVRFNNKDFLPNEKFIQSQVNPTSNISKKNTNTNKHKQKLIIQRSEGAGQKKQCLIKGATRYKFVPEEQQKQKTINKINSHQSSESQLTKYVPNTHANPKPQFTKNNKRVMLEVQQTKTDTDDAFTMKCEEIENEKKKITSLLKEAKIKNKYLEEGSKKQTYLKQSQNIDTVHYSFAQELQSCKQQETINNQEYQNQQLFHQQSPQQYLFLKKETSQKQQQEMLSCIKYANSEVDPMESLTNQRNFQDHINSFNQKIFQEEQNQEILVSIDHEKITEQKKNQCAEQTKKLINSQSQQYEGIHQKQLGENNYQEQSNEENQQQQQYQDNHQEQQCEIGLISNLTNNNNHRQTQSNFNENQQEDQKIYNNEYQHNEQNQIQHSSSFQKLEQESQKQFVNDDQQKQEIVHQSICLAEVRQKQQILPHNQLIEEQNNKIENEKENSTNEVNKEQQIVLQKQTQYQDQQERKKQNLSVEQEILKEEIETNYQQESNHRCEVKTQESLPYQLNQNIQKHNSIQEAKLQSDQQQNLQARNTTECILVQQVPNNKSSYQTNIHPQLNLCFQNNGEKQAYYTACQQNSEKKQQSTEHMQANKQELNQFKKEQLQTNFGAKQQQKEEECLQIQQEPTLNNNTHQIQYDIKRQQKIKKIVTFAEQLQSHPLTEVCEGSQKNELKPILKQQTYLKSAVPAAENGEDEFEFSLDF